MFKICVKAMEMESIECVLRECGNDMQECWV